MTNKSIKELVLGVIKFESQPNLYKVTVIYNKIFKSGFQINYYYDFGSIDQTNLESISRIETLIFSSIPESEINDFEVRSAFYQNNYDLVDGEEEVYLR